MKIVKTAISVGLALSIAGQAAAFDIGSGDFVSLEQLYRSNPAEARKERLFSDRIKQPAIRYDDAGTVRISIVYPGEQISDYWRRSVTSMTSRLDEIGIKYEIDRTFTLPGRELARQANLLMEALNRDPDYLIFTLDALEHGNFIEQIIARDRVKLILQNITTPVRRWQNRQPFLYVGFDHHEGTRMLAERYIQLTGGTARYAILFGTRGYVSEMRGEGFKAYLNDHPGMQIVDAFYVGFDREAARKATLDLLSRHDDIDFIYCVSTDIALGAADALIETGRQDDILINGWGGGASELEAIDDNRIDFTVMRINDDNGVAMADAILLDRMQRRNEIPLVFSGEMVLIDGETSPDTLEELEKRSFRYSGAR